MFFPHLDRSSSFIQTKWSLLLEDIKGDMESLNPEFALHGSKNESTRTDTVFFPLSEVCKNVVSFEIKAIVSGITEKVPS